MDSLVKFLSDGLHPVQVELRPVRTPVAFKECLDRGYVHIKFTDTRGGTELGVRIDRNRTDLSNADFAGGRGKAKVVGTLILNSVKVECTADISLEALGGEGQLKPRSENYAVA